MKTVPQEERQHAGGLPSEDHELERRGRSVARTMCRTWRARRMRVIVPLSPRSLRTFCTRMTRVQECAWMQRNTDAFVH